jgi:hypothetical protein
MSHFVKIRTQIRERPQLVQALRDLHYRFQEGENLVIRGFLNNKERGEVVVDTGCNYDIGFRRGGETYEAVADWDWGIQRQCKLTVDGQPLRQGNFIAQIQRQYAYNIIRDQVREQNLVVEEDRTLENGDRIIIVSERG